MTLADVIGSRTSPPLVGQREFVRIGNDRIAHLMVVVKSDGTEVTLMCACTAIRGGIDFNSLCIAPIVTCLTCLASSGPR